MVDDRDKISKYDDDQIIEFVRTRPCLYNAWDPHYRDRPLKSGLWKELSDKLDKNGGC